MSMTEYVDGTRLVDQYQPSPPSRRTATTAGTSTRHRRRTASVDRARRLRSPRVGALTGYADGSGGARAPRAGGLAGQHRRPHRGAQDGQRVDAVQGTESRDAEREQ